MKYRYLLFDLDGTLIDTTEGVFKCAQYALKHFGIETDFNELRAFFGPPLKVSFSTLYHMPENDADSAVKYYLERYEKEGLKESRVYPEIPSLL
jgi:phosphoglycolate phosphatase